MCDVCWLSQVIMEQFLTICMYRKRVDHDWSKTVFAGEKRVFFIKWLSLYGEAIFNSKIWELLRCIAVMFTLLMYSESCSGRCCWGNKSNYILALDSIIGLDLTSLLLQGIKCLWQKHENHCSSASAALVLVKGKDASVQFLHSISHGLHMFCPLFCLYCE